MALESVTNIADLVATNPVSGDPKSEGDDHLRNIKKALLYHVGTEALFTGNVVVNTGITVFAKNDDTLTTRGSFMQTATGAFVSSQPDTGSSASFYATSSGNVIGSISHTTTATAYNSSSDERLKQNITDLRDQGSVIDAIKVREFEFKADPGKKVSGFVAQELVLAAPQAVTVGEVWQVDASKLVPILVREVQSLRARVASLEKQ